MACDADPDAVALATENLRLLKPNGLQERAAQLRDRAQHFGKSSHLAAAEAAQRLANRSSGAEEELSVRHGVADVFAPFEVSQVLGQSRPDMVITDLPYGEQTSWWNGMGDASSLARSVARHMPSDGVLALTTRGRKVELEGISTLSRFKVGTRAVALVAVSALLAADSS